MSQEHLRHRFIDGVGEVRIHEGMVRMDLLSMSPTQRSEDGNVVPEFSQQLVMSPRAFMRIVRVLGETLQAMEDKGVLSLDRTAVGNETAANDMAPERKPAQPKKTAGGSPNFG